MFEKFSLVLLLKCFIVLAFLSGGDSSAQDFGKVHELVIQGIDAVYDIDFQKALTKFQEAEKVVPGDLRGPFFESTVYFWKAMFSRNRTDYDTYLSLSEKLIEKCEDIVDKNENDLDARMYLGWSYTLRAFLMYMIDKNFLRAASDIKDGYRALTFVVEKQPSYYDAYLGLGVYNYVVSLIPRKLQWLTSILGYSGDREEGKKQLIIAAEKGTYTNTEAKFYLTLLSWREENYQVAENYADQLTSKYPQSPATWMVRGMLLQQQDKMQEAVDAFSKSLEYNKGKESEIVYKVAYGALGSAYFRMNNFQQAVEYGKKYMNYATKDDRINNRLHSIGASLELLGKRNEALDYYKQGRKDFTEDNEWEKFWLRKLNYRINNPITFVDSLLITADNLRATGKLQESLDDYMKINTLDQIISEDSQAQVYQGMGQVYFKMKDYDKAIEQFKLNLNAKPVEEKWLVPEAYFQIGRCLLRLGRKAEAQQYFDKADDINYDYDFKNAMDGKIKNELSKFN
jgi:tetratricopeptide (TPR) repeat protein